MRFSIFVALAALTSLARLGDQPPNDAQPVNPSSSPASDFRTAVNRAIPLVEKSAAEYRKQRQCFSCHHHALPALMLAEAAGRGFQVDRENLREQIDHTAAHLKRGIEDYRKGNGQGGRFDTAGWALWTLDIGEFAANDATEAVAEYLLAANAKPDHWSAASNRPPTEGSPFTTTYVAMRGLTRYGTTEQQPRITERREAALKWLLTTKPTDTEDRVFRLRTLNYLDADREILETAAHDLLMDQKSDGGWSQTADLASDAYATGSVLVALHEAGKLPATDTAYQRGAAFLLTSQLEDGSWRVATRSKPIQKYFESGFPHENDQFISMSATSWAALALLHACPPADPAGE